MSEVENGMYWKERCEQAEKDILRWSNIAYDLASALVEECLDGQDGPKKPICFPPCDCLMHRSLENWGNAQIELLEKLGIRWNFSQSGQ